MIFKLPVKKIMRYGPVTVLSGDTIRSAVSTMKQHGISSVFVTDKENMFVGVLTDVDIVKQGIDENGRIKNMTASDLMSTPIQTIDENDSSDQANWIMGQHHIRHLLVTRKGIPIGVVSARDLFDPTYEEEGGVPFWPHHLLKEVIAVFVMIGILATLVFFSPAPMEPMADPFTTPAHIKPEWYFLAAYQFLKVAEGLSVISADAPKVLGVLLQGAFILVLFLLPFIDNGAERNPKRRIKAMSFGIICILLFIIFTVWGHLS